MTAVALTPEEVIYRELGLFTIPNPGFVRLTTEGATLVENNKFIQLDSTRLALKCIKSLTMNITGYEKVEQSAETIKTKKCDLEGGIDEAVSQQWQKSMQTLKKNVETIIQKELTAATDKISITINQHYTALSARYSKDHAYLKSFHYDVSDKTKFHDPIFINLYEKDFPCKRDVTLLVTDKDDVKKTIILAHKIVLIAVAQFYECEFFMAAFTSPMKSKEIDKTESKEKEKSEISLDDNTLLFRDTTSVAVELLVQFFYLGKEGLKIDSNEDARDLYQLADRLLISNLQELCRPQAYIADIDETDPSKIPPFTPDAGLSNVLKDALDRSNAVTNLKEALAPIIKETKEIENRYKQLDQYMDAPEEKE